MTRSETPQTVRIGIGLRISAFAANCVGAQAIDPQMVVEKLESGEYAHQIANSDDEGCRISTDELAPMFRSGLGLDSDDPSHWHIRRDPVRHQMTAYLKRGFDLQPVKVTINLQPIDRYIKVRLDVDRRTGGIDADEVATLRKAGFTHMIVAVFIVNMGSHGKLYPVADQLPSPNKNIKPGITGADGAYDS